MTPPDLSPEALERLARCLDRHRAYPESSLIMNEALDDAVSALLALAAQGRQEREDKQTYDARHCPECGMGYGHHAWSPVNGKICPTRKP